MVRVDVPWACESSSLQVRGLTSRTGAGSRLIVRKKEKLDEAPVSLLSRLPSRCSPLTLYLKDSNRRDLP
jgi:hypothetical protein